MFEHVVPKATLASAIQIGNPISVAKAIRTLKEYDGVVEQASEAELADAAARADKTGMFNCPHTGVALAALEKLVAAGTIKKSERAVVISTASGLKFTDFKVGYHESKLANVPVCKYANTPINLPNDYGQVRDQVRRLLET
jgi:threonine synthase